MQPATSMTCVLLPVALSAVLSGQLSAQETQVSFDTVQPLLEEHCLACHGEDDAESGLRLDSMLHALRGGGSGEPTIVPGHSGDSHLISRLTTSDADLRMPPDEEPLSTEQIQLLRRWIDQQDQWAEAQRQLQETEPEHWAFQPVARPAVPQSSCQHPIDAFVDARRTAAGLQSSPRASRRILMRRLRLIMHGLPPTPKQMAEFQQDEQPDAWPRLVDDILADSSYGERWATYWLDLIRFAETDGFETNRERPHAWPFRDWVIEAFNSDLPYDRFVQAQLAGDSLGEPVGTGFLVAGPHDIVKGQDRLLGLIQRQDELDGMINTTGTAFLGLTLGCARCHNHKFDPVTQQDYYSLQAMFAGVRHASRQLPLTNDQQQQLVKLEQQQQQLADQLYQFARPVSAFLLLDDQQQADILRPGITARLPAEQIRSASDISEDDFRQTSSTWQATADQSVAAWYGRTPGTYRVWISWSVQQAATPRIVQWVLDLDGNPDTRHDQQLLAEVDQTHNRRGVAPADDASSWSGFLDAGVHRLTGHSSILLKNGKQPGPVTADAILLDAQSVQLAQAPGAPPIRPPVNALLNEEFFPAVSARFVRFHIASTTGSEACLDELEIYSDGQNVALASAGALASSSGDFVHPLHQLSHINDGAYGNPRSWIASAAADAWVQIQLPNLTEIERIVWSRDRDGRYQDRLPTGYRIEVSADGEQWVEVAGSRSRFPTSASGDDIVFDLPSPDSESGQLAHVRQNQLQQLAEQKQQLLKTRDTWAGRFEQPAATHRLYRGDPLSPREQVIPAGIAALTELSLSADAPEHLRREALAEWISSAGNPLTARVMVNRIWQHHFGHGLVETPSDFGRNGVPPTHPQLLDWLAAEFVDSGWSVKHIQRLILTSDTWQQDSRPRSQALQQDAGGRLYWRFTPRRLTAEAIRDSVLTVTGRLNPRQGGPGFSAFQVELENVRHYHPRTEYSDNEWRRMVYQTRVRQERDAVFGPFDCPDNSQNVAKRSRSTTPLQAMGLLNSPFMLQQAGFLADRLRTDAPDDRQRVNQAWQLCFSRLPDEQERDLALQAVRQSGWTQFARALLNSNEFVFIP